MSSKVILVLLAQTMVAMAMLDGQNFYEVTFMDEDSDPNGDEVHCTIHSVQDINGERFTKFIAPANVVATEETVWTEVNSADTFEQCSSSNEVAAASMFRFDGSTCETATTSYTRQRDACEALTGAEFIYLKE